jgi:Holliday junction resolvase RusA-like endonuclease
MIVLDLPVPPSVNNLFMNLRKGKGRARTPQYLNWITTAGWHVQIARQTPIKGPVCVFLETKDNLRRDSDGYWKALLDLLVTHRLIDSDRCATVREHHFKWNKAVECRLTVTKAMEDVI